MILILHVIGLLERYLPPARAAFSGSPRTKEQRETREKKNKKQHNVHHILLQRLGST